MQRCTCACLSLRTVSLLILYIHHITMYACTHCDAVYPGVLDFYRELDLGDIVSSGGPEAWPPGRMGNLVFLSARPHVYKDMRSVW
jgi:hypothetical protein